MLKMNNKGAAMSVAIIVTLIVMIITPIIVLSMNTDAKNSITHNNRVHAYYYARSGIEYVVDTIMEDFDDLLVKNIDRDDFYFYGSLESDFTLVKKDFPIGHEDEEIFVEVKWDGTNGEIIASGNYAGVIETIKRDFFFDADSVSDITMEILFNIDDFILGSDASLVWYSDKGKISNKSGDTDQPVKWSFTKIIYDDNNSENSFNAPLMYFNDIHAEDYYSSLLIESNANELTLQSNFFSFYGNIYFDEGNKKMGQLHFAVYDHESTSTLSGTDLNNKGLRSLDNSIPRLDTLYGLIYFKQRGTSTQESTAIKVKDEVKSYIRNDVVPGFYYFPSGINVSKNNDTGYIGLESLIPVDFEDIDFGGLNLGQYLKPVNVVPEFGLYQ